MGMKPIRVLIVDDEDLCRKGIRLLLREDADFEIVGECANGEEAIRDIDRKQPDVVFLDIQMPEISGFDVVKSLDADRLPLIVFVTAYDQYAIAAFEMHAIDYILKPFTRSRFRKSLERIKGRIRDREASGLGKHLLRMISDWDERGHRKEPPEPSGSGGFLDRILVSDRGSHKVIFVRDIVWIEGADYYVNIHCLEKSFLYRERLKNLEAGLPPSSFVRVHKSAIINLEHLDRIIADAGNDHFAVMKSGARVKLSKNGKKELFQSCRNRFGAKDLL